MRKIENQKEQRDRMVSEIITVKIQAIVFDSD